MAFFFLLTVVRCITTTQLQQTTLFNLALLIIALKFQEFISVNGRKINKHNKKKYNNMSLFANGSMNFKGFFSIEHECSNQSWTESSF